MGFQHSKKALHILMDNLGSSRQFPLLWDFLVEMKKVESFEISQEIFWVVFRAYNRANLPVDAIRAFNNMVDFGIRPYSFCIHCAKRRMWSMPKMFLTAWLFQCSTTFNSISISTGISYDGTCSILAFIAISHFLPQYNPYLKNGYISQEIPQRQTVFNRNPVQIFDTNGERLVRLGSSATKEDQE
ncbi:PPR long domain-containing protein [Abeliophyllum distichum]|uniref:PPR long domain-containing protein n=1 Tax=Abeliophyllum distichum TaxID=126358 RepID=A0ABD1SUW9_9LAMI